MKRIAKWEKALNDYLHKQMALPFGYGPGQQHCCKLTCEAVQAMTGVDMLSWFKNADGSLRYNTELKAYALVRSFAGGGLEQAINKMAATYGLVEITAVRAKTKRGDVVLFDSPDGPGVGICMGADFISVMQKGFGRWSMRLARRMWSI